MSKRNISYVQQDEPSFIKQFKARVGYKEGPTLESKRSRMPEDDDDDDIDSGPDLEDEKPQVVVLKQGDLTAEEAERLGVSTSTGENTVPSSSVGEGPLSRDATGDCLSGRVLFKKPAKKNQDSINNGSSLTVSSHKKDSKRKKLEIKDGNKGKKLSNTKLLSFNEEEEEENN